MIFKNKLGTKRVDKSHNNSSVSLMAYFTCVTHKIGDGYHLADRSRQLDNEIHTSTSHGFSLLSIMMS